MIPASCSLSLMPTLIDSSALPQGYPQPGLRGYEGSDMAIRWVFGFIAFLFVSGIIIQAIIAWQLRSLEKQPPLTDPWTALNRPARRPATPAREFPRLQLSPPADMKAFRAREDAEMRSYGWVDKTAGVVRIPIDRAMNQLLQKGLPVRSGTNNSRANQSNLELQQNRVQQRKPETGNQK